MEKFDVIVIGGGASGMMASIFAARNGNSTLIIDHNEKLGKKLFITGKGRCNLTNNSNIETHLNNIVTNSKFMYSALNAFSPQDTIEFFEANGLKTKTERGNRVFPASDKSSDVIKTLKRCMDNYGVNVALNTDIIKVQKQNDYFHILCNNNIEYTCNSLIVATGGLSYSGTGATKFGYDLAEQFGHKIIAPRAALCPIRLKDDISSLNGLALKNVTLTIEVGGKSFSEFGEMMLTYNSLTGPISLTLSSKINKLNFNSAVAGIDFKPALTVEQLQQKFMREFKEFNKKDIKTYMQSILPVRFVPYFMQKIRLENKKVADITKDERNKMISYLKKFDFNIKSLDNIEVGIVTSGGVDVKEINAKTCESKLVKNLYFVGELLNVDALTGGFNLQIAWSTGYLAGNSIKG